MAENSDREPKEFNMYAYSLEIGFRISIPLVALVILGVWLDRTLHTPHIFLFAGIGLSLFASAYGIKQTIDKFKG